MDDGDHRYEWVMAEAITQGWLPSSIYHKFPPIQRSKTVREPTAGLGAANCSEKRDQPHWNFFCHKKFPRGWAYFQFDPK